MPTFLSVEFCEFKTRIYMYWTTESPLFEACPHALRGWQVPGYFEEEIPPDQNENLLVLAHEAKGVLCSFEGRFSSERAKIWGGWREGVITLSIPFKVWESEECHAFFVYELTLVGKKLRCQLVKFWDTYAYEVWEHPKNFWAEKGQEPGYFRPEI